MLPPAYTVPEKPARTKAMIALYPSPAIQRLLLEPFRDTPHSHEAPTDLHLTLAYLGETAEYQATDHDRLAASLARFAAQHHPVSGVITGTGRFNSEEQPLVALVSGPDLDQLRQEILYLLRDCSFPVPSRKHGFMPHITLSYDMYIRTPHYPRVDVVFDRLYLCWGEDKMYFPMKDPAGLQYTYSWADRV